MTVVLLTGDLMVVSRVAGAAAQCGVELKSASNAAQAIDSCVNVSARMLIVDLSTPSLDLANLVAAVKEPSAQQSNSRAPRIVAFGPHVHEARLAAARAAGCDEVVSRGQFLGQVHSLLQL